MHLFVAAARNLGERDDEIDLDIPAAWRAGRTAPEETVEQTAAAQAQVDAAEDILEIDAAEQILGREAGDPGEAAAIIIRALLRVGEHGVGLGDLLEALLGARLLVAVRMVLQGEAAEGVLDRFLVGITFDAEHFVIVALGGGRHGE